MVESVWYDKDKKVVIKRVAWEEEKEDGSIEHHYSEKVETNRSKKYMRVFTDEFAKAVRVLDKNAIDAFTYIMNKASLADNTAAVSYKKLEKYLELSNKSVNRIMQVLQKKDMIRMVERGSWMINPKYMAGCYEDFYPKLVAMYHSLKSYEEKHRNDDKGDDSEC